MSETDVISRLDALERENQELRSEIRALRTNDTQESSHDLLSRRDALRKVAMVGAGAIAGSVLLAPRAALATTGGMQFGSKNDAGTASTILQSSGSTSTLQLSNSHSLLPNTTPAVEAVLCEGNGYALYCHSINGAASATILAEASGLASAIAGQQSNVSTSVAAVAGSNYSGGPGAGVQGSSSGGPGVIANGAPGIHAVGNGGHAIDAEVSGNAGNALKATILNSNNPAAAAHLVSRSTSALVAEVTEAPTTSPVIDASTVGAGSGVRAISATGRGAEFSGAKAQVRLLPSSAGNHPMSGMRGDLFVDSTGRLWYCRGMKNWKQLA